MKDEERKITRGVCNITFDIMSLGWMNEAKKKKKNKEKRKEEVTQLFIH